MVQIHLITYGQPHWTRGLSESQAYYNRKCVGEAEAKENDEQYGPCIAFRDVLWHALSEESCLIKVVDLTIQGSNKTNKNKYGPNRTTDWIPLYNHIMDHTSPYTTDMTPWEHGTRFGEGGWFRLQSWADGEPLCVAGIEDGWQFRPPPRGVTSSEEYTLCKRYLNMLFQQRPLWWAIAHFL